MQTSLSKFLNIVFKYITLFAIAFVWTNFYFSPLWVAVLLAVLISLFFGLIIAYFSNKKQSSLKLKSAEKKLMEECSYQFLFGDELSTQNFFVNLLNKDYAVEIIKDNIVVTNANNRTLFLPIYASTTLETKDIIKAYILAKQLQLSKVIITCKQACDECTQIAQSVRDVQFTIFDEAQTFKLLLQPHNTYPNFSIELKNVEKLKYSEIKKIAFSKAKTKGYFFSGITLLFASLFTRYNLYYVIMASILFAFALYCMFSSGSKSIEKKDIF